MTHQLQNNVSVHSVKGLLKIHKRWIQSELPFDGSLYDDVECGNVLSKTNTVHGLSCRNPICFDLSFLSRSSFNLSIITLHWTLLGMESHVIPSQLQFRQLDEMIVCPVCRDKYSCSEIFCNRAVTLLLLLDPLCVLLGKSRQDLLPCRFYVLPRTL
jgi:hypothetical protein